MTNWRKDWWRTGVRQRAVWKHRVAGHHFAHVTFKETRQGIKRTHERRFVREAA